MSKKKTAIVQNLHFQIINRNVSSYGIAFHLMTQVDTSILYLYYLLNTKKDKIDVFVDCGEHP